MYLFFDTETTGLPKNWKAPIHEVNNWPRIIQIAWILFDENRKPVSKAYFLIKPDGWTIPEGDFWKQNGYSQAASEAHGLPIRSVLSLFLETLKQSKYLVAHNISFDWAVAGAEMIRAGLLQSDKWPSMLCTKELGTDYCQIPGPYGYKWPTLTELHSKLFDAAFDGAHDSLNDVEACAKCFFGLVDHNVPIVHFRQQ